MSPAGSRLTFGSPRRRVTGDEPEEDEIDPPRHTWHRSRPRKASWPPQKNLRLHRKFADRGQTESQRPQRSPSQVNRPPEPIQDGVSTLETGYLNLTKPLYELCPAIIIGTAKPTPDEIQAGEEQSLKDDPSHKKLSTDSSETAPIPEFWLTALRNHVGTSEIIIDRDVGALKHLADIRVTYASPKPGFKLTFVFTPNEFLENEELEKTYHYQEEVGYSCDFLYDRAVGTVVKWKEDKDLTKDKVTTSHRPSHPSPHPPQMPPSYPLLHPSSGVVALPSSQTLLQPTAAAPVARR